MHHTGADPGFQLKKIAPSGGRSEHFWRISCEKSQFYAKKSCFFFLILAGEGGWIRPCHSYIRRYVMIWNSNSNYFNGYRIYDRRDPSTCKIHRRMGHGFRFLLPPFLYYPLFQNFHINHSFFKMFIIIRFFFIWQYQ